MFLGDYMNDRAHEIFIELNPRIRLRFEEGLLEALDLVYNYAHKYTFREDVLTELEPSEVKRLVSRYFKSIENEFLEDFLYDLRNQFNKLDQDIESVNKSLNEELLDDLMRPNLTKTINRGLDIFDNEFIKDFRSECLYSFRQSSLENPDFDYILTTFKRNLLDRIEEIMNEFKNKTIHQVSRDVLEAKEEYLKELPKEDKVKTNTDFDAIVLGIYASYSTEIETNYMINTSFNNLLAFYENNIKGKNGLLKPSQVDEFNKLYNALMKELEEYKKSQEVLNSKIKPVNNEDELIEATQTEEIEEHEQIKLM